MNDIDIVDQERHGRVVVWDAHGEPVAWLAVGEPVLGTVYNGAGLVAYTHMLTVEEAINVYGPISEWVTGPGGGFRRVCFGTTWFSTPDVVGGFARDTLPPGVITIEDADLEWPCPQCGAPPGQTCQGVTKHRVRRARGEESTRSCSRGLSSPAASTSPPTNGPHSMPPPLSAMRSSRSASTNRTLPTPNEAALRPAKDLVYGLGVVDRSET